MEIPFGIKALCPRSAKEYERTFSERRIMYPHVALNKRKAEFEKISWDHALSLITKRLKEVLEIDGADKILVIDYAGHMGLFTRHLSQRLWYLLRVARTNYNICDKAGDEGIKLHYGSSYGANISEINKAELLVYWGFNPAVTSIHNFQLALKLRRERNVKIVAIDILETETVKVADLWLRPKFATDIYLALGIANYIIENKLYDRDFIDKYTTGFDEFKRYVSKFTLDVVSKKTGVPKYLIKRFAKLYAQSKPNIIFIGYGLQRRIGGGETVRAISLLPALIGVHRGFYYSNTDGLNIDIPYVRGAWLGNPSRIIPQSKLGEFLKRGDFKFVFICLTNPVATYPNSKAIKDGLLRDDVFVVVHDTHWSDTALYADVVLPAPTWLEKADVMISYWHDYIGISKPLLRPLGESRSEIEVMREIARRLQIEDESLFEDELSILKKILDPITYETLIRKGYARIPTRKIDEYQTPSSKIEFASTIALKNNLHQFPEPINIVTPRDYPYVLVCISSLKYTHSQFEDVYGDIPPFLFISEKDMVELGIKEGDIVVLENEKGRVKLIARKSNAVPEGVVFAFKACRTLEGKRINEIVSDMINELNGATLNSTFVRLIKYTS